jgi:hypothetical protein
MTGSSEMSVSFYRITWPYSPENSTVHSHRSEGFSANRVRHLIVRILIVAVKLHRRTVSNKMLFLYFPSRMLREKIPRNGQLPDVTEKYVACKRHCVSRSLYYFFTGYTAPLRPPRLWFFSFLIILQTVGLLGRVISSSQGLYLNTGQHKHRLNTYTYQTSMPCVGFEHTIPASERAKTVHALDRSVTVTGTLYSVRAKTF